MDSTSLSGQPNLLCAISQESTRARVLNLTDEGSLWLCKEGDSVKIQALIKKHVVGVTKVAFPGHPLTIGDMCIVKLDDTTLYRAEVYNFLSSKTFSRQAEIFLIDQGRWMVVPIQQLHLLPELMLYPAIAEQYWLKGIKPSKKCWSDVAMKFLTELCTSAPNQGIIVDAEFGPPNCVTLLCNINNRRVNLNEELIKAGLATACSDHGELPANDFKSPWRFHGDPLPEQKRSLDPVGIHQGSNVVYSKQEASPVISHRVYVETENTLDPIWVLDSAGFPVSVCKELSTLGFCRPTTVQAYTWPLISAGQSVLAISPPGSGKTLAYLIPLLVSAISCPDMPNLLVLVHSSWQARSVHLQAQRIMTLVNAENRFQCCCVYCGGETEALHQIINGVSVVIGTPPALLRLVQRGALELSTISKLAIDDGNLLLSSFPDELLLIIKLCRGGVLPLQSVVMGSLWSPLIRNIAMECTPDIQLVMTCAIEAVLRAGSDMRVVTCTEDNKVAALQQCIGNLRKDSVICTSTVDEAIKLHKILQLNSWCVTCVLDECSASMESAQITIVPDDSLCYLFDGQRLITQIVHYSFPSAKSMFRLRLSLLFQAIKKGTHCSSIALVTPECKLQSLMFSQLLKRSGQPVPVALKELSDSTSKERTKLKQEYDLCYYMKAWGYCKLEKCTSLHNMISPTSTVPHHSVVPSNGVVRVMVCHVSNATRLWVSLLEHLPLRRGDPCVPCHDRSVFTKLSLELAEYYSDTNNRQLHGNPCEGDYCGFQDSDGSLYRVQVLKFSQPLGLFFHHKEKARVRLIDVGCVLIVDVNQLLTLPGWFLHVPLQVMEVFMCGLKPCDKDLDWPAEAVNYMTNALQGKVIQGHVAFSCGNTMWLDPIEHKITLKGIAVKTSLFNPLKELRSSHLAEPNPDHLECLKTALGVSSEDVTSHKVWYCSLPCDSEQYTEVLVSAVSSPELFYIQIVQNEDSLVRVETLLNEGKGTSSSGSKLSAGDYCCAKFPIDNKWYRGLVLELKENQKKICFVDYGDTEWVSDGLVQCINDDLLQLPFQAIECSLFNPNNYQWSPAAGEKLWENSRDCVLQVKVIDVCKSDMAGWTHYVVELNNSSHEDNGTTFSSMLRISDCSSEDQNTACTGASALASQLVEQLSRTESFDDKAAILEQLQTVVFSVHTNVLPNDLDYLCQLLAEKDSTVVILLRLFSALSSLQKSTVVKIIQDKNVELLSECNDPDVAKHILLLMSAVIPEIKVGISTSQWSLFMHGCKRWLNNPSLTLYLLEMLAVVLQYDPQLCELLDSKSIQTICTLMMESQPLLLPCLRIVNCLSGNNSTWTVVQTHLPMSAVQKIVNSVTPEWKFEVTQQLCYLLLALSTIRSSDQVQVLSKLAFCLHNRMQSPIISLLLCDLLPRCHSHWKVLPSSCMCSPMSVKPTEEIKAISDPLVPKELVSHTNMQPVADKHGVWSSDKSQDMLHCPKVLWRQSESYVILTVVLKRCNEVNATLSSLFNSINFKASVNSVPYAFHIGLYATISSDSSGLTVTKTDTCVILKMLKQTCKPWPRLTESELQPDYVVSDIEHSSDEVFCSTKPSVSMQLKYGTFSLPQEHNSDVSDEGSVGSWGVDM